MTRVVSTCRQEGVMYVHATVCTGLLLHHDRCIRRSSASLTGIGFAGWHDGRLDEEKAVGFGDARRTSQRGRLRNVPYAA
jgi:hypothetical protein